MLTNFSNVKVRFFSKVKLSSDSDSFTNRWTCSGSSNVQKNNVWVSSMSNVVNLVKALLGSMFICSKPKKGVWVPSQIDEHVRVRLMFEKWRLSSFDKMVFDPSL